MHTRLQDRSNRRLEFENESATSRMFFSYRSAMDLWEMSWNELFGWRNVLGVSPEASEIVDGGPYLGHSDKIRRDSAPSTATVPRIVPSRLCAVHPAFMKRKSG